MSTLSSLSTGTVVEIETIDQFNEVISADKPSFIDFTASWCGPCKKIYPTIVKLASATPQVQFCKLDVDTEGFNQVLQKLGIRAMPTFKMFYKGQCLGNGVVGANQQAIETYISNSLKSLSGSVEVQSDDVSD